VPWSIELIATRAIDMAKHLNAEVVNEGEIHTRRIKSITFCARSVPHMVEHFKPGSLLVTSADRPDVIIAAALSAMNGVEIGAMLLTGGYDLPKEIQDLCQRAFDTGLPVIKAQGNTWQTSLNLQSFTLEVPADDKERIEYINDHVASHIDGPWIDSLSEGTQGTRRLSPPAFRYQLTELARKAAKRIVLPEGEEPRTVKAAAICAERGIANCVLLGNPDEIRRVAAQQGVELGAGVEIIDSSNVRENYVPRLVELRGKKGMTEVVAREKLEDSVYLGTMMLENNEVDGLVSGAVHTTANTIVPPFQIIKTAPNTSIVSSIFFMLLPDQVLVYGDCAINPDPNAEQLAEIAIQSAESAAAFGIDPRVAMISYSTGESGKGADVDKVREATKIAQEKRPDLVIDGPLQYDAAIMENVAASKAPNSPVAGKATVFVFPDLNTGNTTYKAVQRSADLVSIGPMLQGMRKPVNDLSRGALVDDIVYTIALTAIQASQADA
jgi:phosphate acetyltransferase